MTPADNAAGTSVHDLRDFLKLLERTPRQGIAIVDRPVDTHFELSAVVKAMESSDNRAVMFNNTTDNNDIPVLMNLYGDPQRTALALRLPPGSTPADTIRTFDERVDTDIPAMMLDRGPVHDVVHTTDCADLHSLPISVHAAEQGGKYITAGVLVVRDQTTGLHNGGIYRVMVTGRDQFTVSVDPGHDLGRVIARGIQTGEDVSFALVLGGDPAYFLVSQAKVPTTRDLYDVMGGLIGQPAQVVRCQTNDLSVPAHSEIVIEGHISPGEHHPEGPFGEFSYYYGTDPAATLCRVDAITHRHNPIYADIHPIHADHRSLWLHPGREVSLLRRLRAAVPGVKMVSLPLEGAGMIALISMNKTHNGDPRRALLVALSSDVFIKHAVVVDNDVDVHNPTQVVWALSARFQADRDVTIVPGLPGYIEDPSGYFADDEQQSGKLTTKIGYDATIPLGTNFPTPADVPAPGFESLNFLDYVTNPLSDPPYSTLTQANR